MKKIPKLSIIIVVWNCWDYLIDCINSIKDTVIDTEFEVIIIDSNSLSEAPDKLYSMVERITVLRLPANVGFSRSNNIALEKAEGKYILVLNPDTIVHADTIDKSIAYLDSHSDYAVVGVKNVKANGRIDMQCVQRFPSLWRLICKEMMLDKVFRKSKLMGGTAMPFWDHNDNREVDMVAGSYIMMRNEVYKEIGGFDETIPMYVDDVEFCMRVRRGGMRIFYIADCSITHFIGGSAKKASPRWMNNMKCEASYYLLSKEKGIRSAKIFVFFLLFLYPVKLIFLPGLVLGRMYYNHQNCIKYELSALVYSWIWAVRKVLNFEKILCPQQELPDA